MRVGFLGPAGTYSHEALARLPEAAGWELAGRPSVHAAVLAVQRGEVDRALVPLENSLEGSVNATLDALVLEAPDVEIAGEIVHPVHHCLVTRGPVELDAVATVTSHPQASAQCAAFLRAELPRAAVLAAASTAEAVRAVAGGDPSDGTAVGAAIGSRAAAALYGGHILRSGIEDVAGNETRFAWLAPAGTAPVAFPAHRDDDADRAAADDAATRPWRTALVWWGVGSESAGWLVRCLSEFAFRGVNLTRIESRPRKELGMGEYMFFADIDGRVEDVALREAVAGLGSHAVTVRVLGSFPVAG